MRWVLRARIRVSNAKSCCTASGVRTLAQPTAQPGAESVDSDDGQKQVDDVPASVELDAGT